MNDKEILDLFDNMQKMIDTLKNSLEECREVIIMQGKILEKTMDINDKILEYLNLEQEKPKNLDYII